VLDLVEVYRKNDVVIPRKYSDYVVNVKEAEMPSGVTCIQM
jgi:hypothetical protein